MVIIQNLTATILHNSRGFENRISETLAKSDMEDTTWLSEKASTRRLVRRGIEQDTVVDTNRTDWSVDPEPQANGVAEAAQREVGKASKDIASVEEGDESQSFGEWVAEFEI